MRARLTAALLAAVVAAGVVSQSSQSAGAATADDPAARVKAAQQDVAGLRAEVEAATAELSAGTVALEENQARLAAVRAEAVATRAEADAAVTASEVARARLADVVAANFMKPPVGQLSAVLTGTTDLNDLVVAQHDREAVQGDQRDLLRAADGQRVRADALVRTAEQLEAQAAEEERQVAVQVEELKASSLRIRDRLTAAAVRLEAAEAAKRAADEKAAREKAAREAAAREAARDARERAAAAAAAAAGRQRAAVSIDVPPAPAPVSGGGGGTGSGCGGSVSGGYPNGFIPASALCSIGGGHALRGDAAAAFLAMSAAYPGGLCVTDSYRSYAAQVDVYRRKPGLAAVPGNSNHGFGIAVDFCGGIQRFGSGAHEWMVANAGRFGWVHPSWAQQGGSKPEAWHWEFQG